VVLTRGQTLEAVNAEHNFQMSGMVDDASAVGIGQYLGAKAVITGTFDRFANFSQFRIRVIDVGSSALLARYSARIRNNDPVLADVTQPLQKAKAPAIREDALAALNRGKDYFAEGKYDQAIQEFDKVLAANKELGEAYFFRGVAYYYKKDYDRAIADYNEALRIDPNYAFALNNRGYAYRQKGDYDRAIADLNEALRINPNFASALHNRGFVYNEKGDHDRAIADFAATSRLDPSNQTYRDNLQGAQDTKAGER
jgi:tetratricopeptide (TPR) repeat protein